MEYSAHTKWHRWQLQRHLCFRTGLSLLALLCLCSCYRNEHAKGYVSVHSPQAGTYEVYRVANESPLQLVSEQLGTFNERLELTPGNYLLFADCSSASIVVHPKTEHRLIAHAITFTPPSETQSKDRFSVQCTRYAKSQMRQNLVNEFSIHMFRGKHNILVGMTPITIDVTANEPRSFNYNLSSFRIGESDSSNETRYFVSPTGDKLAVTESQQLGSRLLLLAGEYWVELNGTKLKFSLAEAEERAIQPGFLKITTPKKVDLSRSQRIRGNPLYVEINGGHWLSLNETYVVLPGEIKLRLVGSEQEHTYTVGSNALLTQQARSVQVGLDCPPWDWACFGSKKVFLFEKGRHYPFAQGVTDVPLLYFEEDAWVSVESSRNILYHLPRKRSYVQLRTGQVELNPRQEYRSGFHTDLTRMETIGPPFDGRSLDIPLTHKTTMTLIAGPYYLAQYVSQSSGDGDRHRQRRRINVTARHTTPVSFTSYVSEKQIAQAQKRKQKRRVSQRRARRRRLARESSPTSPLRFQ